MIAAADARIKLMRTRARSIRLPLKPSRELAVGIVAVAGLAMFVAGVWSIYAPAGLMTGGVLLVTLALGFQRGSEGNS